MHVSEPSESSRALLEATHQFPGPYVVKAIGRGGEMFVAAVVAVVRGRLTQDFDAPYEVARTASGRHVSVTITPWVESADDVFALYEDLRALEGLVMLL